MQGKSPIQSDTELYVTLADEASFWRGDFLRLEVLTQCNGYSRHARHHTHHAKANPITVAVKAETSTTVLKTSVESGFISGY